MAIKVGDGVLMIGADTTQLDKSLKSIGDKMEKVGKNLTMKLTLPLVAFGAMAIKTAADFSKAMAKVNAVTGATEEQFAALNDQAKALGETTQFTATQVAEAMTFMGMAGMDAAQIMEAIPDTLNLAAAGALDMGTAANIVTNILAGFGMETSDLGRAVDVLTKSFTSSNVDLNMLGESMKYAGPVAKGFGMEFEETAAIMGIFGNAGIQASMAGTSLRAAVVQLDKKAEEFGLTMYDTTGKMLPMADILEQLEAQGLTSSEMMELFGLRAGPAMMALLDQGSGALRSFTDELRNAGGTAESVAQVQMEGIHGVLVKLKSKFEGLQLTIAEYIVPILEKLVDKLKIAMDWFMNLSDDQRGWIVKTTIAVAALGPALLILSQVIKAVAAVQWLWNAALAANPIGLIILGVVALGASMAALGVLIHRNWDGILAFFSRIGNGIKTIFMNIAEYMYQPIKIAVDWIISAINGLIRGINGMLGWAGVHINEIAWSMPPSLFGNEQAGKSGQAAQGEASGTITPEGYGATPQGYVTSYANGGPIMGDTALTNVATGRTYAMAHDGEQVGNGGFKTANIIVMLDRQVLAEELGTELVRQIKISTGVKL